MVRPIARGQAAVGDHQGNLGCRRGLLPCRAMNLAFATRWAAWLSWIQVFLTKWVPGPLSGLGEQSLAFPCRQGTNSHRLPGYLAIPGDSCFLVHGMPIGQGALVCHGPRKPGQTDRRSAKAPWPIGALRIKVIGTNWSTGDQSDLVLMVYCKPWEFACLGRSVDRDQAAVVYRGPPPPSPRGLS